MESKIRQMFEMQDTLNSSILSDNYKELNIPFYRAAIVEAVELMEHRGYKWWKAGNDYDVHQAQLEIVDIWHFIMSQFLSIERVSVDELLNANLLKSMCNEFNLELGVSISKESQLIEIDTFIQCMSSSQFSDYFIAFTRLMNAFDLSFTQLYEMYVCKNVLNKFRQDHGYKDGSYNKNGWVDKSGNFVEDNVVLAEVTDFTSVYEFLESRYPDD